MIASDKKYTLTPAEIETSMPNFRFRGPGWYFTSAHTVLAIPYDRDIDKWWHQSVRPDEAFNFYVWELKDPTAMINAIVNAPTRQDDR